MVGLLASHTRMQVIEAGDGMLIEPDHIYVIPPGRVLKVAAGLLALSAMPVEPGPRLPFDALLKSVAAQYGHQAICCILSGNGADGSVGLLEIKDHGGRVFVQDPEEADFDGMPRSAIATGRVDQVGSLSHLGALILGAPASPAKAAPDNAEYAAQFDEILAVLLTETGHDFALYKRGTISRRIERRMALAGSGGKIDDDLPRQLAHR